MNHLSYYSYQAKARGVRSLEDVIRIARQREHVYSRVVGGWLPKNRNLPIAEIACGHGSFLYWLKSAGYTTVSGIDSSPEQVAFAKLVGSVVEQDEALLWLARQPAGRLAAIIAIDLVEHISKDDFMELLHLAHAALVPGGSLILRLPNGDSPFVGMNLFNDITHVWTYTPNALNSLAQMHGFLTTQFVDEGSDAIRDHRWLKVPLAKITTQLLRCLVRMATRENIRLWSPHLWACLRKQKLKTDSSA